MRGQSSPLDDAHALAVGICNRMLGHLHQCEAPLRQRDRFNRRPSSVALEDVVGAVLHDERLDETTAAFLIRELSRSECAQLAVATADWLYASQPQLGTTPGVLDAALVAAASTNFKPDIALRMYTRRHDCDIKPSLQAANMALTACSHSGDVERALQVLEAMPQQGLQPNEYSILMVLQAANFKRRGLHKEAARAVASAPHSLASSPEISAQVIEVFESAMRRSASVDEAAAVFNELKGLGLADATRSYNALLRVCAKHGEWQRARAFFDQMAEEDVPADTATFNALISACLRGNALSHALDIFEWMVAGRDVSTDLPADTETYNILIKACHQAGLLEKALEIASWVMAIGVQFDKTTFDELIATVEVAQIWDQKVIKGSAVTQPLHTTRSAMNADTTVDGTPLTTEKEREAIAAQEGNEGMVPLAVFPGHLRPAPHEPMRFQYIEHVGELQEEAALAAAKLGGPSWASTLMSGSKPPLFGSGGKAIPPGVQSARGPHVFTQDSPRSEPWKVPKLPKLIGHASPIDLSRAPSFRNLSLENTHSRYLTLPMTPQRQSPRVADKDPVRGVTSQNDVLPSPRRGSVGLGSPKRKAATLAGPGMMTGDGAGPQLPPALAAVR